MNYKILGSVWYGTIGMVLIDDGYEQKAYIGIGYGDNQKEDEQHIASYGMPFDLEFTKKMVGC